VDLPPGDHLVRLEADGIEPAVRTVRAEGTHVEAPIATTPAPAPLAARQWTARYASSPAIDTQPSMRLLSRAVAGQNLLLIAAEPEARGTRLRAALATSGAVSARAERLARPHRAVSDETRALLREIFVRGGIVVERPLYQNPIFWTALGLAAAAAAVITGVLLAPVPSRTIVSF
jgi:hypothetical protein